MHLLFICQSSYPLPDSLFIQFNFYLTSGTYWLLFHGTLSSFTLCSTSGDPKRAGFIFRGKYVTFLSEAIAFHHG